RALPRSEKCDVLTPGRMSYATKEQRNKPPRFPLRLTSTPFPEPPEPSQGSSGPRSAPMSAPIARVSTNRWGQLVLGIICMASVANLQYGWTLFVLPIQHQTGWTKAEIQVAFSIFILLETWLVPFEGAIVDRIGPRWMVLA